MNGRCTLRGHLAPTRRDRGTTSYTCGKAPLGKTIYIIEECDWNTETVYLEDFKQKWNVKTSN